MQVIITWQLQIWQRTKPAKENKRSLDHFWILLMTSYLITKIKITNSLKIELNKHFSLCCLFYPYTKGPLIQFIKSTSILSHSANNMQRLARYFEYCLSLKCSGRLLCRTALTLLESKDSLSTDISPRLRAMYLTLNKHIQIVQLNNFSYLVGPNVCYGWPISNIC